MATARCIVLMEEIADPTGRMASIWRPRLDYDANPSFSGSVLANAREFCLVEVNGDPVEIASLSIAPETYVFAADGSLPAQHHAAVRALMNSVGLPAGLGFNVTAMQAAIHAVQATQTDADRAAAKQRARVRQAGLP